MGRIKTSADAKSKLLKASAIIGAIFTVLALGGLSYLKFFSTIDDSVETVMISSYEELKGLKNKKLNDNYYLMNDIIVDDPEFQFDKANNPLIGSFNGNGHRITYSTSLNKPFVSVNLGIISDVCFDAAELYIENYSFGVVAETNKGSIKDCLVVSDKVTKKDKFTFGGVVAYNEGTVHHVVSSVAFRDFKATTENRVIGGIVGYNLEKATIKQSISLTSFEISSSEKDDLLNGQINVLNTGLVYGVRHAKSTIDNVGVVLNAEMICSDVNDQDITVKEEYSDFLESEYLEKTMGFDTSEIWDFSGSFPTLKPRI